jgi:hypothetical protein
MKRARTCSMADHLVFAALIRDRNCRAEAAI